MEIRLQSEQCGGENNTDDGEWEPIFTRNWLGTRPGSFAYKNAGVNETLPRVTEKDLKANQRGRLSDQGYMNYAYEGSQVKPLNQTNVQD